VSPTTGVGTVVVGVARWAPTPADSLMNRSVAGPRRRYRCTACARFWSQDTSAAAEPRAKISRGGLAWARRALVIDHQSISRAAAELGVAWKTANDAVLTEGHRRLINDPTRLDSVAVLGVDEHVWRHTRFGEAITFKHNSSLNSWVNRRRDAVMLRLSFSRAPNLRGPTVRNS